MEDSVQKWLGGDVIRNGIIDVLETEHQSRKKRGN